MGHSQHFYLKQTEMLVGHETEGFGNKRNSLQKFDNTYQSNPLFFVRIRVARLQSRQQSIKTAAWRIKGDSQLVNLNNGLLPLS